MYTTEGSNFTILVYTGINSWFSASYALIQYTIFFLL